MNPHIIFPAAGLLLFLLGWPPLLLPSVGVTGSA